MNVLIAICCRRAPSILGRTALSTLAPAWRPAARTSPILTRAYRLHTLTLTRSLTSPTGATPSPISTSRVLRVFPSFAPFQRSAPRGARSPSPAPFPRSRPPSPPQKTWWTRFRRQVDAVPPSWIIWIIIGINVAVWIQWNVAITNAQRFNDQKLLQFMMRNFMSSWDNWQRGRWWTLLTTSFSQISTMHLGVNCLILYLSGPTLIATFGVSPFLGVYLVGGAISSLVSIYWRGNKPGQSVGASGATYAALSLYACVFPTAQFALFGIIPLPAWACMGGVFLYELGCMFYQGRGKVGVGGIDNAGHVGGLLAGVAMWWFRFRRFVPRL